MLDDTGVLSAAQAAQKRIRHTTIRTDPLSAAQAAQKFIASITDCVLRLSAAQAAQKQRHYSGITWKRALRRTGGSDVLVKT